MRFTIMMLFACIGLTYAADTYSQTAKLTLNVQNQSVQRVLDEIEKQSEFHFFYNNKQVNTDRLVSMNAKNKDVFTVLKQLFEGTEISYKVLDKNIILSEKELIASAGEQQQIKKVTGKITDESGEPIPGANIIEKGSTNGTISDMEGRFTLSVPSKAVLVISFMGFETKEVQVANKSVINVQLGEDNQSLKEVVVTALGIKREEKALGYAVQKVSGDDFSTIKPVNLATSLTGKVAGLNIQNSPEFNSAPSISLRGSSPLLVVDGVPYENVSLKDIPADDIESVDVLKGATASALYGARGGAGAIMITTKKASKEGLQVTVNSSTMFDAGYIKRPEVQTSYSSGRGGKYATGDYVWGDKLDIGRTAVQYDPFTYEMKEMPLVSKGKDNLKNFQTLGLVTNNNVSVAQKGKYGSVRTSLTHVFNKGKYPNQKLNKISYAVSGDITWKGFKFEGGLTYNKRLFPNDMGAGYGGSGFLYNLLVWSGAEYDIRDYKDYWRIPDQEQNWFDETWYDNPYFIANEITRASDYDIVNGYLSAAYDFTPWLHFSLRSGLDSYSEKMEWRNAMSARGGWDRNGYYCLQRQGGHSLNNDFLLSADHTFGDFSVDGFIGGTVYYYKNDDLMAETQNGLTIPGYYSLKASVDNVKASAGVHKKLVNSLYGKVSGSWKSTIFVDVTGRNDWSSTLPSETRSYFYPSVAGSVVLSEFIPMPEQIDFWKVRASWTKTKKDLSVYETNNAYSISNNLYNGSSAAYYPGSIRGSSVLPSATRSYEIGTGINLLKNRFKVDFTYYNKLYYNLTRSAGISEASGFSSTLINIDEEQLRKGFEITLSGDVIKTKDWKWNSMFNWARDRFYYSKVDPIYSTQKPWVAEGKRWDWVSVYDYERDPEGNMIHQAGMPIISQYDKVYGYSEPDWIWGWNNTISYKNFILNFSFDGRVGGIMHSRTDQAMWNSGSHIESDNQWRYDEVVNGKTNYVGKGVKVVSGSVDYDANGNITRDDRVFAPNDTEVSYESYMMYMNPYIGSVRSQHLLNQTFFKLRNLSLTYQVPRNICEKVRLNGLSVAFVGQDLFVWTKEFKYSDPDRASENLNSPSCRYLGFNVKFDF